MKAIKIGFGLCGLLVLGCCGADAPSSPTEGRLSANIRYTQHGIPHIKADDYAGAGYGLGYAFAKENLCLMADWFTTLRGERSLYFGADQGYPEVFVSFHTGPVNNLKSDAFYRYLHTQEAISKMREGASQEVRDLVRGYTQGYNRYLADTPVSQRPKACADAPWAGPIEEADIWRRAQQFTLLESFNLFSMAIVNADPAEDKAAAIPTKNQLASLEQHAATRAGSNAIAWGRDATKNGKGLLFGNPHFPWQGRERQYAAHLTIGDEYDVFGSTIYGLPVPMLGFNESMAWSVTYSTDQRFAIYEVETAEDDPTAYRIGDTVKQMRKVDVAVPLRSDDGSVTEERFTFWETDYGPVLEAGPFTWGNGKAYTIHDVNRANVYALNQYLAIGKAKSVGAVKTTLGDIMGLNFSNVVAADDTGDTMFANYSVALNLPNDRLETCVTKPLGQSLMAAFNVLVADGSNPKCAPVTTADAPFAGAVPAGGRPSVIRSDYVLSANDSHWAVHGDPATFQEGFHRTIGDERQVRGERYREGIRLIEATLKSGERFDADTVEAFFHGATNMTGRMVRDGLLAHCADGKATATHKRACDALSQWDGTSRIDARGAHLMREIMERLPRIFAAAYKLNPSIWSVPFDPADPVNTPRGLVMTDDVATAVTKSVEALDARQIALDATLGSVQSFNIDGERIAASGNPYTLHLLRTTWNEETGTYEGPVPIGDSFIQVVSFGEDGPEARFVMSYSQSTDPASPHYQDQLPRYLNDDWFALPYRDADIQADPEFKSVVLTQP